MKKVFQEVMSLDKNCYQNYHLSEEVLMENAAVALVNIIRKKLEKNPLF